ncbi:MAG: TolC family protein [Kiritimatiellae bacterium]|nr:TolC family protein [Kiritimatiellia bacterium]
MAFALAMAVGGCLSPEKAERDADETARELATAYWQAQTGSTNEFSIARPMEALTLKIALEAVRQGVTNAIFPRIEGVARLAPGSNGLVRLSLQDALALGAQNNRRYQTLKEAVYTKALTLDSERYEFDTRFTGFLIGALAGEPEIYKNTAEAGAGAKRKFENGTTIAGNLAVDVVRMLRDDWHSTGLTGDLTVTVPLLRGAGRDIVREPLTQAERNLAYALLAFARYRQTYALSVAKAYYSVLEYAQNRRNSDDNARRLEQNWDRAEMMFKAGRMDRIQVDQAKTDLLAARQTIITKQQSYEDALDSFKITLGIVPEAPVALKDEELASLEAEMAACATNQPHALADFPDETSALNIALTRRADLAATRGDVADCERAVKVAADALKADVTVEGGGEIDEERRQHKPYGGTESTFARIKLSMPWDRRRERNAYRKAQIDLDQSRRTFEEAEDNVKNEVRAGYRNLVAARALYENKVESLRTAQMRVDSNDLFMQSGRSSMRDILEAESAMLTARNALCSAVISWRISDLSLRTAMGTLEVK